MPLETGCPLNGYPTVTRVKLSLVDNVFGEDGSLGLLEACGASNVLQEIRRGVRGGLSTDTFENAAHSIRKKTIPAVLRSFRVLVRYSLGLVHDAGKTFRKLEPLFWTK